MSDLEPGRGGGRKPVTTTRIMVWVITAAFGAYLVLSGIFGILAKG